MSVHRYFCSPIKLIGAFFELAITFHPGQLILRMRLPCSATVEQIVQHLDIDLNTHCILLVRRLHPILLTYIDTAHREKLRQQVCV